MKNIFALGLALLAVTASPSFATPVIHQVTAVINAAIAVPVVGGVGAAINIYPAVSFSGFPFTLGEGDTIQFNVSTINGGITVNDGGAGLDEFLGFTNIITNSGYIPPGGMVTPSSPIVVTFDQATTITVTNSAGDLANASLTNTVSVLSPTTSLNAAGRGNITDSSVTLYDFTVATTYTNLIYQPDYEYLAAYDVIPGNGVVALAGDFTATPAPGALALLGLGVFGFGGLRRKKNAA